MRIPETFTAGTTLRLRAGTGTVLILRGACTADLSADGDGIVLASAAVTKEWLPGNVAYSLRKTEKNGDISEISSGSMLILPDISSLPAGADTRSQNRRTYDAICAVIENRASRDQQEYKIGNRELKRLPISDLLKLRAVFGSFVAQENGRAGFVEHKVRF
ncbi:hypothetical protein [Bombella pollinis]|uniref:Uncharacterized protein n=1 Tax=Bombella pollinis TaxID=2967337 RepID=A0ABT3WLD6_9PROT|nr:hypothetical protein [Bombella pollinis]MCX5619912.1 hypothetical protein [Bombella pollinis]